MRRKDRDYWEKRFKKQAEEIDKEFKRRREAARADKEARKMLETMKKHLKPINKNIPVFNTQIVHIVPLNRYPEREPITEKEYFICMADLKKINTIDEFIKYLGEE